MSVHRGLFLRRLITVLPAKTIHSRKNTLILLVCALCVGAFSTDLILSGLAERRAKADNSISSNPTRNTKLRPMSARGPLAAANACAAPFSALQGCTVACDATVSGTGNVGAAVSFQSTATATGCTTQPAFNWDFGDGGISSLQNPTHSYAAAGTYTWTLTTSASSGGLTIDTIAGGLGDGAPTTQASFTTLVAVASDPMGRGVYVVDATENATFIRFINTSGSPVTLGTRSIAPGTTRVIAGGGSSFGSNTPGLQANVGNVAGLAVSTNGNLVYFVDQGDGGLVRAVNVSGGAISFGGASIGAGNVGTLAGFGGAVLNGLTTHPSNGEVYTIDTAPGVNKVFRITNDGATAAVAGNGVNTAVDFPFTPGAALGIPLREPRAVKFDGTGNLYIADSGHARVIRVSGGNASLVHQFSPIFDDIGLNRNPYPSGIAVQGGNVYVSNGNQHAIWRITNGVTRIAGNVIQQSGAPVGVPCDFSANNCGDNGASLNAGFNLLGSGSTPPIAGLDADANGLFVADQPAKGRVRYINLSGGGVTLGGVGVSPGTTNTIAGTGLPAPFDGGIAIGASFNAPTGVAVDGTGNLWVSDTNSDILRFVNQGASQVTIFAGTPSAQNVPPGAIVTVNKNFGSGSGDDLPVIQASFDKPQGLFVTAQGVYLVDSNGGPKVPANINGEETSLLRFINTSPSSVTFYPGAGGNAISVPPGEIRTIAGCPDLCGGQVTGFAKNVSFKGASDVAVGPNGTIYITDVRNKAVRRIDASSGNVTALTFPSGQKEYTGVGFTTDGRLLVANFTDGSVLRENSVGSGTFGNFGTPLTNLANVRDVAGAPNGIAYAITGTPPTIGGIPTGNHRIVQISSTGSTLVLAGGTPGFDGDGGAATGGRINAAPPRLVLRSVNGLVDVPETTNIAVGQNGEILFTDSNNNRVRQISGQISACMRTGTVTVSGANPIPVLSSIDPTNRLNGSGAFMLRAIGDKFAPNSVIRLDNVSQPTNFESATELTASVPASVLETAGMAKSILVSVFTPPSTSGGGGGSSLNILTFTVIGNNPDPTITSIEPTEKREGEAAFLLAVNGTGFINGASVVRYDGTPRPTTFINPNRLMAAIAAEDLIGPGTVNITVFNPAPMGGESNPLPFIIRPGQADPPVLTSISPNSISAGSAAFSLVATGSKFTSSSKVHWNGAGGNVDLVTAFGSETQLTAQVPANLVASQGTAQVTVITPPPGGGTSGAVTFTIGPPGNNPVPALTSLNPPVVGVSHPAINLIINGTGFTGASQAQINGTNRPTTSVSSTKLSVAIPAGVIPASPGNVTVRVTNPTPGGGNSNTLNLVVVPKFTSVNAASFAGEMAADSVVAGFGLGIGNGVNFAATVPLPPNLNGTELKVTDSTGTERQAGLFFVSGPANQINYQMPPGTANGVATAVVTLNGTAVAAGPANIASLAPGLVTFSGTGVGLMAAVVLRVRGNDQTFENIFQLQGGGIVPLPIDMGPPTDGVFLIAFGTGMQNNSGAANTIVDLNGATFPLSQLFGGIFASGLVGVQQANILLPRSLILTNGQINTVNMRLIIDGKPTNVVQFAVAPQ